MSAAVERTTVLSGGRRLAAVVHPPKGKAKGSVAVGHPHPAHGGNMDHAVVRAMAERAAAAGLLAMRFDVGGVRDSEGDVNDAASHMADVVAVSDAAARRAPGPRYGAGFSYGARLWIEAHRRGVAPAVAGLLLLAPATRVPTTAADFGHLLLGRPIRDAARDPDAIEGLEALRVPSRILVGEADVVAPPGEIRAAVSAAATVTVLPGLNHFFHRGSGGGAPDLAVLLPAIDGAWRDLVQSQKA